MKFVLTLQALSLAALVSSAPLPQATSTDTNPFNPQDQFDNAQEHSHENFVTLVRAALQKNNPLKLGDPIEALLGDANAAPGLDGSEISDVECFQAAVADTAFTNAKADNDLNSMIAALTYRTLQRNKGVLGISNPCTSFKPVNPEVAALSQHQNPNSVNAAATNKQSALDLAKQISSIGGDPQLAIKSGTFAAGAPTCDGIGPIISDGLQSFDADGCIFTLNLLSPDVTADEITSFVG